MRVIAKAYMDRPLDRIATAATGNLVYLLNPSTAEAKRFSEVSGVGFPKWAVFEHDSALLESLERAWISRDQDRLSDLWEQAKLCGCEELYDHKPTPKG